MFKQTNIGIVSRATSGRLLRDGAERMWAFRGLRCHLEQKLKTEEKGEAGRGGGGKRREVGKGCSEDIFIDIYAVILSNSIIDFFIVSCEKILRC